MHWSTWSKPFFGITGALALLQIAQASSVQAANEVTPAGQEGSALKADPQLIDKIYASSRNKNGPIDGHPDVSSGAEKESDPAVDNAGENDTYKPVRHDIRLQVDPCAVASKLTQGRIPYEIAKACLNADFPFPRSHREDTVKTIKSLITNFFVFEDLAARPPSGDYVKGLTLTPVNITSEIDQLLKQSQRSLAVNDEIDALSIDVDDDEDEDQDDEDDGEFENEGMVAEVNQSMGSSIEQEIESDNVQDKSSVMSSTDMLASSPMTHREFHDGLSRILTKPHDGHLSYTADCFRAFEFRLGFFMSHLVREGKTVLKVSYVEPYLRETNRLNDDILGCEVVKIGGMNAADYVQQWADKHESSSKDPNVRFNVALTRPVYDTPTSWRILFGTFGRRFELPEEPSLAFEFQCPRYFLFWRVPPIKANLKWTATYNRQPFTDTRSYYDANCIKPGFNNNEIEGEHDLKDKTDEMPAQTIPDKADEKMTMFSQFTPQQLPVVKHYDEQASVTEEVEWTPDAASVRELYRGKHGISALLLSDDKTGIITLPSVHPEDPNQGYRDYLSEWMGSLIPAIETLRPRAENLIVDLSHNGGGYICVGVSMMNVFFPDRPRSVTNIRRSPIADQLLRVGALRAGNFISSYGNSTEAVFDTNRFPGTVTHPQRPNMVFTDYISDACREADQFKLKVDPEEERQRNRTSASNTNNVYRPWDPENIVILTNGFCGSTCALISNMMHTKFGVKTVVIGGKSPASAEEMSYSTFPGLEVLDDAFIFKNIEAVQQVQEDRLNTQGSQNGAEKGGEGKTQKAFAVGNNKEEEAEPGAEPGYSELVVPYPASFAHQSTMRMTWRQIYRTGNTLEQFVHSEKDDSYKPAWGNVEQWNEYTLLPATKRLDYTENNVGDVARIWADTRDAVWGSSE
ncbi:hypothetical protein EC968_004457 [Mortierella alpina]|nr:hypothetical protein EC968_004457 [Mortierella alpina]